MEVTVETTKVKDLMVALGEYTTVSENATLYDAVLALQAAMKKKNEGGYPHRAVLVLDKNGRAIGKLTQLDVLRSLEPRYGEMGDLKKVSGFGLSAEYLKSAMQDYDLWKAPLEHLCRKSADLGVGQIVSSPLEGESIDSDASLNQAVHQMIMGHHQSLLITSKGEIVGILRLTDVFDEVGKRMKACRI